MDLSDGQEPTVVLATSSLAGCHLNDPASHAKAQGAAGLDQWAVWARCDTCRRDENFKAPQHGGGLCPGDPTPQRPGHPHHVAR